MPTIRKNSCGETEMIIQTKGFAVAVHDPDYGGLTYIYCVDDSGYCLSLARFPEDELVEVMVLDQMNHKTREVAAELSRDELRVRLSVSAAAVLDRIMEYVVPLAATEEELRELDAALTVIFADGNRGRYDRRM